QVLMRDQANGQLLERDGRPIGSAIIAQGFASPAYFYSRASAAGQGYDATSSGGTNLGPTNKKPIDRVTTSASGFDPHLSPDAAMFQVPRVARARGIDESELREFVAGRVEGRQLGFLGEPRVNVLLLNLAMDERWPAAAAADAIRR